LYTRATKAEKFQVRRAICPVFPLFVGTDHYWAEPIKGRYIDTLKPLFAFGKPVVITEFGFSTTNAPAIGGALAMGNVG
jgi:hypothetical protein